MDGDKMGWKFAGELENVLAQLVGGAQEGVTIGELGRE